MLRRISSATAYLLIIELVFIPSAQLTILKIVTILALLFLLVAGLAARQMRVSRAVLMLFVFVTLFLMLSFLLGLLQVSIDVNVSVRTLASYFVVFLTVLLLYLSVKNKLVDKVKALRLFIYSMSLFVVVKSILMLAPFFGWITPREFMELMNGHMLVGFRSEDALFVRLATGNDLLLPFALFFLLFEESYGLQFSSKLKKVFLVLFLLGIALTFTRYIWVVSIVAITFYAIDKKMILKLFVAAIVFLTLFVAADECLELGVVKEMGVRFGDSASIDKKSEQAGILINGIDNYALFGKGLGSYIETYIRSTYIPSQYETQWLSLALQFGIVGVFFILFVMLIPLIPLVSKGLRAKRTSLYLASLYTLFLMSAFTNPNLFILNVVMVYFLVSIMTLNLDGRNCIRQAHKWIVL